MFTKFSNSIIFILMIITLISCGQTRPSRIAEEPTNEPTPKPTEANFVTEPLEPINLPLVAKWEQWNFVIQKADVYTSVKDGKVKPDNDLFLVLVGDLENHSEKSDCWTVINWKLKNTKTDEEFDFSFKAATPLESVYTDSNVPGLFSGICVESGEKQSIFVVFDVKQNAELALTLYKGQPVKLFTANYLASVPTAIPTNTPIPTDTPIATNTPISANTSTPENTPSIPAEAVESSQVEATFTPSPACPNLQAQINSPAPGTWFDSRYVLISGNANIPNFNYYKFEYSTDPSSSNWNYLLQQDTPVENDKLMELDTTTVPPGPYGLRLTVVDLTGNYPEPCVVWFNTLESRSPELVFPTTAPNQPVPDVALPPPSNSGGGCCKYCGSNSYACGDSCISLSKACHKGPGCACD